MVVVVPFVDTLLLFSSFFFSLSVFSFQFFFFFLFTLYFWETVSSVLQSQVVSPASRRVGGRPIGNLMFVTKSIYISLEVRGECGVAFA